QLAQSIQTQQCPEWCWAASISMIFAFYGHPLSQASIVQQTYGSVTCLPAFSNYIIGSDLSRSYIDANGRRFSSQVIAGFDPQNGYYTLNNAQILSELAANHPLIYCNTHHAEVLYSISYTGDPSLPTVQSASVIDPWPLSPRSHALNPSE